MDGSESLEINDRLRLPQGARDSFDRRLVVAATRQDFGRFRLFVERARSRQLSRVLARASVQPFAVAFSTFGKRRRPSNLEELRRESTRLAPVFTEVRGGGDEHNQTLLS